MEQVTYCGPILSFLPAAHYLRISRHKLDALRLLQTKIYSTCKRHLTNVTICCGAILYDFVRKTNKVSVFLNPQEIFLLKLFLTTKYDLFYSVNVLPLFPSLNWPRMFTAYK